MKLHILLLVFGVVVLSNSAFAQYAYEYKYGDNQYNYDVEGYSDGDYVSGNVDTNGKYISGYLTDENGDEKSFDGEWTSYGEIEGYDEDGNYVELAVE